MAYGIKVYKKDLDSITNQKKLSSRKYNLVNAHVLLTLALPYLRGARIELKRYRYAVSQLDEDSINASNNCLHEISCLFEDLGSIAYYTNLCGENHSSSQLYIDIRNHIRHDVRENFDTDDGRKNKRAKTLCIPKKYQTLISFDSNSIKIGGTLVMLDSISDYLDWATEVINTAIAEAWKKGKIKINEGDKKGKD